MNTTLVSLAVMAGVVALAGAPLRCWQFLESRITPLSHQPGNALLNSAVKREKSASGKRLIPAAASLPPPVSNFRHSVSAPRGFAIGARTLTA
jgi:hypothetical protein